MGRRVLVVGLVVAAFGLGYVVADALIRAAMVREFLEEAHRW